jgi:hypothetical protein
MSDDDNDDVMPRMSTGDEGAADVTFVPGDETVEVPWPRKHALVFPDNCDAPAAGDDDDGAVAVSFVQLPHPRTRGGHALFALHAPAGGGTPRLLEVQEQRAAHCCWFLNDGVEPNGALYVLTPIDATWFAVYLAARDERLASDVLEKAAKAMDFAGDASKIEAPPTNSKFVSSFDLFLKDSRVHALPAAVRAQIEAALATVCDVKRVASTLSAAEGGADEVFYRLNLVKLLAWLRARHAAVRASPELQAALFEGGKAPDGDDGAYASLRALMVLLDYVPQELHAAAAAACGVALVSSAAVARHAATDRVRLRGEEEELAGGSAAELARKKSKLEPQKSAGAKRLEKAGPGKNQPSMMSFFKKK